MADACQRFVGGAIEPDPDRLIQAVELFASAVPLSASPAERFMLQDRLRITTENAAHEFHTQFHRYVLVRCDCRWTPARRTASWGDVTVSPTRLLL